MYNLRTVLSRLSIYRQLAEDQVLQNLGRAVDAVLEAPARNLEAVDRFQQAMFQLWEQGLSYPDHILDLILFDDNPFSRIAEHCAEKQLGQGLRQAVQADLDLLYELIHLDLRRLAQQMGIEVIILPETVPGARVLELEMAGNLAASQYWPGCLEQLIAHYSRNFRGTVGRYGALRWDSQCGLVGVEHPEAVALEDLIAYQSQKEQVCSNTERFLHGYPANHILLYGPRGTGKSSLVKALRQRYWQEGLRLVELAREDLHSMSRVVEVLQGYAARFILFIDDLSFEDYETQYKGFKAALEGSLQSRPQNMLVYATSNRRHLIREFFSDRKVTDEEVHGQETMQEKLSLADRFGLNITFPAPNQQLYLEMVEKMARKQGIVMDPEVLRRRALEWERLRHGPSGRTARQFVDSLDRKYYPEHE
ncbi:MAG TPA: ATP-binding protein [Syntrophomonadaceae bacterium]|nr:ATP-binding protein [Syntrophomonadaceae bacterium]